MVDHNHQELTKLRGLLTRLANEIDYKNHVLLEKEGLSLEKFATMSSWIEEKDRLLGERSDVIGSLMAHKHRLQEAFVEEKRKSEQMKQEMKNFRDKSKVLQQKLETRTKELEELRTLNNMGPETVTTYSTNARRGLKTSDIDNESSDFFQKHDELQNNLKELDHLRAQNETVRAQLKTLSKELNDKGAALHELENLRKELNEKQEALHQLESVNQTLISNEHSSTIELKAARMEAIKFFLAMDGNGIKVGIKKIGELDPKPFRDICFKKFCSRSWEEKSDELYSLWQQNVKEPSWNPFKNGELSETVDESDEKLMALREEWGEEAYKAVVKALVELKEYNPSKSSIIPEIWNFEEGRRAYMKEAIQYIIQNWEILKNKENEQSGAIIELMAEKERLFEKMAGSNILMEEKDKLLKEKYAVVGKLMERDKEKDTLLGKMSATINTLTAEKHNILKSFNAEKRKMQYIKDEMENLKNELQSQEVEKQTEKHRENQTGPIAKKLKDSKVHYVNEQISSTSENRKGENSFARLKQHKADPDEVREPSNGGLFQSRTFKAVVSSPLQYSMPSMVLDRNFQEIVENQE